MHKYNYPLQQQQKKKKTIETETVENEVFSFNSPYKLKSQWNKLPSPTNKTQMDKNPNFNKNSSKQHQEA